MPVERITALVRGASSETFDDLALEVFGYQYERNAGYRELCNRSGATPAVVSDWRDVPAAPLSAGTGPVLAGTRQGSAGRDLHTAVIEHSFAAACLVGMERPPVLSLIPSGEESSDPGLGLLADHVLRTLAAPDSLVAAARHGVEAAKARSFLGSRQRDRRPTLILATTATLDQLVAALERRGLRFRLPPGSRVVETGRRGPGGGGPLARLADGLGVLPDRVVYGYGIAGMVTRFYAGHGQGGEPRPFLPLRWARVRILDPETGAELPAGAEGALAVFDLASVGTVAHVLTGETGIAGEDGFWLTAGATAGPESPEA